MIQQNEFRLPTLEGFLRIFKVDESGDKDLIFQETNLIVNSGMLLALTQLHYPVGFGDPISYAKVGTGGANDSGGLFLKTPDVNQTDLYSPCDIAPVILTGSSLSPPSITLMANVDNSQSNGLYLNEAGFFSTSGKMFNIKVFPRVFKKSSFALNLEWVIKYNV